MVIHLLNIIEMLLGTLLIFLAVILWSVSRKLSCQLLSITSILFYAIIVLSVLEKYKIIDRYWFFKYKAISILKYALPILTVISFIIGLIIFISEEKRPK